MSLTPDFPAGNRAQNYRNAPASAIPSLSRKIADRILSSGPLRFDEFMAIALYDPADGYYARSTAQVGREGDFFTSVSVGPLFGKLLARRFLALWETCDSPSRWRVTECGAHDGKLAADILAEIHFLSPTAFAALEYAIVEPLPLLRSVQISRVPHIRHVSRASELARNPLPGLVFGNEVLDALPCRLLTFLSGKWQEKYVSLAPDGSFAWEFLPTPDPGIGPRPEGYQTEIRTNYTDFLTPLVHSLEKGALIWIDYGFPRPEYYDISRTSGTLRTFSRHTSGENPLLSPGETDITAHVDFTAVAEAGEILGIEPSVFESQGTWLTKLAVPLLRKTSSWSSREIRQFQTLIHPAHLGSRFHILEQTKGFGIEQREIRGNLRPVFLRL